MKKTILTFILAVVGLATMFAQSEPTKMVIVQKDGSTATYQLDDIDSIYFQAEPTASKVYKIDVPTDFSTGRVQKVMVGDKQVAEICNEYVRSWGESDNVIDDVLTVVYPMGADGKADLSKGLASNGASIAWDVEGDSVASYTAGTADLTTIYLTADGTFVSSMPDDAEEVATSLTPYVINDVRSKTDAQTYKVVKIATQYWMDSNLKAVTLRDGTAITLYTSTQEDAWNNTTAPAYHIYADDTEYCWPDYGAMYNGFAVVSEGGLAPEGWEVSTIDQWEALKTYLKTGQSKKIKITDTWQTPGTNVTGLSISPGGYFSSATGDDMEGSRVYYWTPDKTTSFGSDALKLAYIVNGITLTSTHSYYFGHYVRCVRK